MNLIENLTRISLAFEEDKIPFALAGGFAFSIHIMPRSTVDIDFLIMTNEDIPVIETNLKRIFPDLISHKKSFDAGDFELYRFVGIAEEEIIIDILCGKNREFTENAVKRRKYIPINSVDVPILSLEDLYIMKKNSERYQDKHDCEMIEKAKGNELDYEYINQVIKV